jgi:hypothetical protein
LHSQALAGEGQRQCRGVTHVSCVRDVEDVQRVPLCGGCVAVNASHTRRGFPHGGTFVEPAADASSIAGRADYLAVSRRPARAKTSAWTCEIQSSTSGLPLASAVSRSIPAASPLTRMAHHGDSSQENWGESLIVG